MNLGLLLVGLAVVGRQPDVERGFDAALARSCCDFSGSYS